MQLAPLALVERAKGMMIGKRGGGEANLHQLRREMILALSMRLVGAAASFGLNWLVARNFGAGGTGLYAIAVTTTSFAAMMSAMGLESIIVRSVAVARQRDRLPDAAASVRYALRLVACVSLAIAAVIALGSGFLTRAVFDSSGAQPFLFILSFSIPCLALTRIATATFRAANRIFLSQLVDGPLGTGSAFLVLGAFGVLHIHGSVGGVAVLYMLGTALSIGVSALYLRRLLRSWGAGGQSDVSTVDGLAILGSLSTAVFLEWFSGAMIANVQGAASLGMFRIAGQVAALFNLVTVAANLITGPHLAAAHAVGDFRRIRAIISMSAILSVVLSLPILIPILFFPAFVMGIFGHDFTPGASILLLLTAAAMINLMTGPTGIALIMAGKTRLNLYYNVLALVIGVPILYGCVGWQGAFGAALGLALISLVRQGAALFFVIRVYAGNGSARGGEPVIL